MKIFIIVGMPASGKGIAGEYALNGGYPCFSTGDIVREEVRRRGLTPGPDTMAAVSDELRGEDGMGVTRRALAKALELETRIVFLEGMRSWPEIELVREQAEAVVVAFLAPRPMRKERIVTRGRADDSPEAFDARDRREIDYGAAIPIALADAYILNTSTMEKAVEDLDKIVQSHLG